MDKKMAEEISAIIDNKVKFRDIEAKYFLAYWQSGDSKNYDEFLKMASGAGIPEARISLAKAYYVDFFVRDDTHNLDIAAEYLIDNYEKLDQEGKLILASILANELFKDHTKQKAQEVVADIQKGLGDQKIILVQADNKRYYYQIDSND